MTKRTRRKLRAAVFCASFVQTDFRSDKHLVSNSEDEGRNTCEFPRKVSVTVVGSESKLHSQISVKF
jgi:hypothetical protein